SYFAGSPGEGTKQGLVANANTLVVSNSYFKDFKDTSNDAMPIIIWNAAGPFLIKNNYLEGSGENMIVGGGDPSISQLVPGMNVGSGPECPADFGQGPVYAGLCVTQNYFFKPTQWATDTSTQRGASFRKHWRIKNLFELKNAENVVVDGNVFENNWIQADQQGFAIVFTPRNQSGGCPWCKIQNVAFANNLVKNSIAGFNLLVTDDINPSGQLSNVTVQNNLFVNINATAAPSGTSAADRAGRLVQFLNPWPNYSSKANPTGPMNVTMDHNTAFSTR
ncbi:MAG: hypothetical protein DMD81_00360, partial [Candidatus Rokuibacteriota bacterium]